MTGWVALMPLTLTDAEKRCLEAIDRLGSYFGTGSLDTDVLDALEAREFLSAHRSERYGALIYEVTETGRLWLKRCAENTGGYTLDDDLTALFNSLDASVQRRFAAWAAAMIGMELHPEAVDDCRRRAALIAVRPGKAAEAPQSHASGRG